MQAYQKAFIQLAIQRGALKFGEFQLKSGRISPYFFNAGIFNQGSDLSQLGRFYAQTLVDANIDFDLLFGPAYKGIPLASVTAMALNDVHGKNCGIVYNRKEAKTHGEGGALVGAELKGRVVIVDDVITAGTAIREVIEMVQASKAELAAVLIALDRQEKGKNELSAIQEIAAQYNVPVMSIITLESLIQYLGQTSELSKYLPEIKLYREQYGVC